MSKAMPKPIKERDWRHDLGEPLLAIRLYAQMLRSEADLDLQMRQTLLEAIEGQAVLLHQRLEEILGEALSDPDR
jgi:signal transduction histidine kinase